MTTPDDLTSTDVDALAASVYADAHGISWDLLTEDDEHDVARIKDKIFLFVAAREEKARAEGEVAIIRHFGLHKSGVKYEDLEAEVARLREIIDRMAGEHDGTAVERDAFKKALTWIKDSLGAVCDQFEICDHRSCDDSCSAWMVANEFLNGNYELPAEEPLQINVSSNRHGVKNPLNFIEDLDVPAYQAVEKNDQKP